MWNRSLSKERFPTPYERFHACRSLQQALAKAGAKRLVVGHTPQLTGANCECDNSVWRIDVGMSYGVLNRSVQVGRSLARSLARSAGRQWHTSPGAQCAGWHLRCCPGGKVAAAAAAAVLRWLWSLYLHRHA